ncbi:MAG: DUF1684 domain-containing protein [Bacteroidota bacterium]
MSFITVKVEAQTYQDTIKLHQQHLTNEYLNPEKSPLSQQDLKEFKGHDFFPINAAFKVRAQFERTADAVPFLMKTTTDRLPYYQVYGVATFNINGKAYRLNIYQSLRLRQTVAQENPLFLPFTDTTNGIETYGGGRFIDLSVPEENTITIDFNKAYNPYCAYSPRYSCPIPPKENDLAIAITAGIKKPK